MKIKCVAIDDEPLALNIISDYCEQIPYLDLMGKFDSAFDAIEFIQKNNIKLIFLDINIPDINGLKLSKFIPSDTLIIFITAYEEHALKSYDIGALDYLLKPVSFERFLVATEKCKNQVNSTIISPLTKKNEPDHLIVRSDKELIRIQIDEILFIESLKDYARIYLQNNDKIIIRESLQNILKRLEPYHFMQVHRSHVVSINKIDAFSGNLLRFGSYKIQVSRRYKPKVVEMFRQQGILGERK